MIDKTFIPSKVNGQEWINYLYYDDIKGICCQDIFCQVPFLSLNFSTIYQQTIPEIIKELPFKMIIIVSFSLIISLYFYMKCKKIPLNLLDHTINNPNKEVILLVFLCFSLIFLVLERVIDFMWSTGQNLPASGHITILTITTAIFFPLIILIVNGNKNFRHSVVPFPEILLRYSYALPITIMLLSILGFSAFPMNHYWMRLTVVMAVLMAGFVLLRFIHITLKPVLWQKTEDKILDYHVCNSIQEIYFYLSNKNKGETEINNKLKSIKPHILYFYKSPNLNDNCVKKIIRTNKTGKLYDIKWKVLSSIIEEVKFFENNTSEENRDILQYQSNKTINFQIVIYVHKEKIIEKNEQAIATIFYVRNDNFTDEKINNIANMLIDSFVIKPYAEIDLSCERLNIYFAKQHSIGTNAIKKNDDNLANYISNSYKKIIKSTLVTFNKLKIDYSLESIKSGWLPEWMPITRTFENIRKWTEDAFLLDRKTSTNLEYEIISYTPGIIAQISLLEEHRNLFCFKKTIDLALYQQNLEKREGKLLIPKDWLQSLDKYSLKNELEENAHDNEKSNKILKFVRLYLKTVSDLIKAGIDSDYSDTFEQSLNLLKESIQIFTYISIEPNIEILEYQNKITDEKKEQLEILKAKKCLKDKIRAWKKEIYIESATYCLLQIDDLGRSDKKATKESIKDRFNKLFKLLPTDFIQLVKLNNSIDDSTILKKWEWHTWERIGESEDGIISFDTYVSKLFKYLFLNSISKGCNEQGLEDIHLHENQIHYYKSELPVDERDIDELNNELEQLKIDKMTKDNLSRLKEWCYKIVNTSIRSLEDRIIEKKVSTTIVKNFKEDFEDAFLKTNSFRKLFDTKIIPKEENNLIASWGLNTIIEREFFIENEKIIYGEMGKDYGTQLARNERYFILKKITTKCTKLDELKTASELILKGIEKGIDVKEIVIFSAQKSLEFLDYFENEPNFKFDYQVESHPLKNMANGFIKYEKVLIPVINTYLKKRPKDLPNLLLVNKTKVVIKIYRPHTEIEFLDKAGFTFELINPLENTDKSKELKKYLSENERLKNKPIGLYLQLKMLAMTEIYFEENPIGIKL